MKILPLLALLLGLFFTTANAEEKPNVILILADDLAIGDLSCFNDGRSRTPRLDGLINDSLYFTNAYSGSPVCAPSRAALLTGRYPHRTGSVTLNQRNYPDLTRLKLDETTIADRFQENGYATGLVGKWHSGPGKAYHPLSRGFDEFVGFTESWDVKTYFKYELDIQGETKSIEGPHLTDELTRYSIDFVRKHRDEPFFLFLAHYAPHRPLSAPEETIKKYIEAGLDEKIAIVYAMIEEMDRGIGELLDELEKLKIDERTIVIFSSDNGPDPLVGERFNLQNSGTKYMITEGGIHVPLSVRWKGTVTPGTSDALIQFTDFFPTFAEICDLQEKTPGKPLDGQSFAGLLKGEDAKLPERRFWQWNRTVPDYTHNGAVREGPWKLIRPYVTRNIPKSPSGEAPQLYHIGKDPGETTDLSAQEPELRNRLLKALDSWSSEVEKERQRDVK